MNMLKTLTRYPWIPVLLLPLFFFLHGWNEHWKDLDRVDVLPLLGAHLVASLAVFLMFKWIYKDYAKAGLLTTFLFALHFFFGSVQDFFHDHVNLSFLSRYVVLLPLMGMGYAYLMYRLKKTSPGKRIMGFLGLLLLVLVALEIILIPFHDLGMDIRTNAPAGPRAKASYPDIYYIVTDEYASSKAIREYMGHDNSAMDSALAAMGFRLMPDMHSNYNFTPFSVASTLNMRYLSWIPDTTSCTPEDYNRCARDIRNNLVCSELAGMGYEIRNNSIFDLPGEPSPVGSDFLPVKGKLLMSQTMLMRVKKDLGHLILTGPLEIGVLSKDLIYGPGKKTDTLISRTIREAERRGTGPRFVYTHLFLPHPPFYVDSLGRPKDKATLQREMDSPTAAAYRQYLPFANAKILGLIKAIREKNDGPAIIILLSDHGFRGHGEPMPREQYFMNYAAIHLPANLDSSFQTPASNVNVFRELFKLLKLPAHDPVPDVTVFLKDKPEN